MAIVYIDGHTISGNSLSSGEFKLPASAAVGDLAICVYYCRVYSTDNSFSGPTLDGSIASYDVSARGRLWVQYKFLTSTEITDGHVGHWTAGGTGNATNGEIVAVFRYVDTTTPLDGVTPQVYENGGASSWDPAAVTPTTTGATVVVVGGGRDNMSATWSVSSNYTWDTPSANNQTDVDYSCWSQTGGTDGSCIVEWRLDRPGSTSEDPGTVGTLNSAVAVVCYTFALKPGKVTLTTTAASGSATAQSAGLSKKSSLATTASSASATAQNAILYFKRSVVTTASSASLTASTALLSVKRGLVTTAASASLSAESAEISEQGKVYVVTTAASASLNSGTITSRYKFTIQNQAAATGSLTAQSALLRLRSLNTTLSSASLTSSAAILHFKWSLTTTASSGSASTQNAVLYRKRTVATSASSASLTSQDARLRMRSLNTTVASGSLTASACVLIRAMRTTASSASLTAQDGRLRMRSLNTTAASASLTAASAILNEQGRIYPTTVASSASLTAATAALHFRFSLHTTASSGSLTASAAALRVRTMRTTASSASLTTSDARLRLRSLNTIASSASLTATGTVTAGPAAVQIVTLVASASLTAVAAAASLVPPIIETGGRVCRYCGKANVYDTSDRGWYRGVTYAVRMRRCTYCGRKQ